MLGYQVGVQRKSLTVNIEMQRERRVRESERFIGRQNMCHFGQGHKQRTTWEAELKKCSGNKNVSSMEIRLIGITSTFIRMHS